MKKIALLLFLSVHFFAFSQSQKININELDAYAKKLMVDFKITGMSVAIVRNDSILFVKAYGNKEIHKNTPVNTNTTFGIGSISKSFTALTLGLLVAQGKINWDDKVKKYLPDFQLYDPYVTENFTIRDLLIHRSGLKSESGGMLWYHSDLSRTEVMKGLKYLHPISGFRTEPAYQNVMYLVASEIVKAVSGMSWDDFLKKNIFDKIKMPNSVSRANDREANSNRALPHILNDKGELQVIEQENGDNMAPAGFIYSSSNDMANYIRLLLNDGKFEGKEIVPKTVLDEIFKPQIHFPIFPEPINNEFTSYGFGWWITPKNGHKIIEHSGGIDGMTANLIMVKDMNIGIIAVGNTDNFAPILMTWKLLEQVLNDKPYDLYDKYLNRYNNSIAHQKEYMQQKEKSRIKNTQTSLPLKAYAGVYNDKMYGNIFVKLNGENLEIMFPHTSIFHGILKHWENNTFLIDWNDPRIPNGFLTFNLSASKEIEGISLDQKKLLDVDFSELEIKKLK